MIAFEVNDMTCGHCASTITKSLKAADPNAKVTIDIGRHLVIVEPAAADSDDLREAIVDAGVRGFAHWLEQRHNVPLIREGFRRRSAR